MPGRSRRGQNEVNLRCVAASPVPDRDERGPLVADDHGIAVVIAGRRWLHAAHPEHHYFLAWSDATGYRLSSPSSQSDAGERAKPHTTELTLYTRRGQFSWELPIGQDTIRTSLGRWLTHIRESS